MARKGFIDNDDLDLRPGELVQLGPDDLPFIEGEVVIAERVVTSPDELAAAMLEFAKQLEITSAALVTLAELIKDLPTNESNT